MYILFRDVGAGVAELLTADLIGGEMQKSLIRSLQTDHMIGVDGRIVRRRR